MESLLYRTDAWLIAALLAAAMVVLTEGFFRLGRRRATDTAKDLGPIDTGIAGLLGLLLAFSFSMAESRFDARRQLVVEEANAIGTAYLRCALLDGVDRTFCEDRLRRYVDVRVETYEARDDARIEAARHESEQIQGDIWERVTAAVHARPSYPALGLLVQAMNQLIDLQGLRVATARGRVPEAVTLVLVGLCLAWACFAGYTFGLRGNRQRLAWLGFSAMVAMLVMVTLDLDRPWRGLVTLDTPYRSMLDLRDTLRKQ